MDLDFNARLKALSKKIDAQKQRIVELTGKEKVIAEAKAAATAKIAAIEAEIGLVTLKAKEAAAAAAAAAAKEAATAAVKNAVAPVVAAVVDAVDVVRVPKA